ncbi:MAG: hypothetical protein LUD38_10710, partial [Parabacteroides sp.]|nr:hypothetical protein [Parabacteroides sp.]
MVNYSENFSTDSGSTLVVTGTVNAEEGGTSGSLGNAGKAIQVGGDLVTSTTNFFENAEDTEGVGVFELTETADLTLDGSLTPDQIGEMGIIGSLTQTQGVNFTGNETYKTPYQ